MATEQPAGVQAIIPSRTGLSRPVYIAEKSAAECAEDPLLEGFEVDDGPAKGAVEGKIRNLLNRDAWAQTVLFLLEAETNALLALASVCVDGNPQRSGWQNPFLQSIGGNPYVNLLARDRRYRKHVLRDGRTQLSTAVLWGLLEVVLRDRPGPRGTYPLVFGFVDEDNDPSQRAFSTVLFRAQKVEQQQQQWVSTASGLVVPVHPDLVVVRDAGEPLPVERDFDAYRPVRSRRAPRSVSPARKRRPRTTATGRPKRGHSRSRRRK
jgi:hypothetical protein